MLEALVVVGDPFLKPRDHESCYSLYSTDLTDSSICLAHRPAENDVAFLFVPNTCNKNLQNLRSSRFSWYTLNMDSSQIWVIVTELSEPEGKQKRRLMTTLGMDESRLGWVYPEESRSSKFPKPQVLDIHSNLILGVYEIMIEGLSNNYGNTKAVVVSDMISDLNNWRLHKAKHADVLVVGNQKGFVESVADALSNLGYSAAPILKILTTEGMRLRGGGCVRIVGLFSDADKADIMRRYDLHPHP